jgi:hypothetical protein
LQLHNDDEEERVPGTTVKNVARPWFPTSSGTRQASETLCCLDTHASIR